MAFNVVSLTSNLIVDHQSGVTVRHCLKVYSCVRDKWLLFCCRTAEEKRRWLTAMAEERRLVAQDRNDGLEFPAATRQLARLAASRQQYRPPIKPRSKFAFQLCPTLTWGACSVSFYAFKINENISQLYGATLGNFIFHSFVRNLLNSFVNPTFYCRQNVQEGIGVRNADDDRTRCHQLAGTKSRHLVHVW